MVPAEQDAFRSFLAKTEASFDEAAGAGLPPFLTHPRESTPLNATPYLVRYSVFRDAVSDWPGRRELVARLDDLLGALEPSGLLVDAILVGGSFTELDKATIGDIDCLLFYRIGPAARPDAVRGLGTIQRDAKAQGLDVRFVPLDGDPVILIKIVSYFTILYSKHKQDNAIVRSLLLLDRRADKAPAS